MPDQQFPIGRRISVPGDFAEPVVLGSVRPPGDGFACRVRLSDGTADEAILSRDEAAALFGQQAAAPTSVKPADAEGIRLLLESSRIRRFCKYDRHFAVGDKRSVRLCETQPRNVLPCGHLSNQVPSRVSRSSFFE
jgi:hypothetical protein